MGKRKRIISRVASIIAAFIMVQTLYFKFTAAPESVYIFSTLGMEPSGRIITGIGEIIASVLILIPSVSWSGAILALGLMSGALFFHFTKLGFIVMDDGGQLFAYACTTFICSLIIVLFNFGKIPVLKKLVKNQS